MSTGQRQAASAPQHKEAPSELEKLLSRSVKYTPFAERDEIELTFGQVKQFISARTKSGATATDADIVKFMMLCKARGLNPWVGDAYLVGYDGKDGPQFSLITSIQALLKRAEAHPAMDGMQSGVIVEREGGLTEREGDFVARGERLVGGWAKCYRKDRTIATYDSLDVAVYDKGMSQWSKDKAGMIVKCAEASVLRKAFPSQLAGMYVAQEAAAITHQPESPASSAKPKTLSDLIARDIAPSVEAASNIDPLAEYAAAIDAATSEDAARDIFERACGTSGPLKADQHDEAAVYMRARIDQLKGGAK